MWKQRTVRRGGQAADLPWAPIREIWVEAQLCSFLTGAVAGYLLFQAFMFPSVEGGPAHSFIHQAFGGRASFAPGSGDGKPEGGPQI